MTTARRTWILTTAFATLAHSFAFSPAKASETGAMPNMPGMDTSDMRGMINPDENMNMSGMPQKNNPAPAGITTENASATKFSVDPTPIQTRKELKLDFNVLGDPEGSQPSLSLPALQKIASEHNPTLIQARAQIEGETGKAKQAGLYTNPAIAYNGDLMGLPRAGAGEWQGGMIQQEIILGSKLKLSRQKYLARIEATKHQLQAQTFKVSNDVQMHYYRVLAAVQRLKLQNELWKSVRDHWLTIGEMSNLGEANQADRYLANVTQEEQRLKVMEAENDLMYAWENLTTVLGVDMPY
ncbi:MAG: TolC family protein, partial [Candidatus Obscuribacterales bacterium]|nr:TolC family protein [Candidatus Obscuribacterales bacterium]